jgi:hypothetical protein
MPRFVFFILSSYKFSGSLGIGREATTSNPKEPILFGSAVINRVGVFPAKNGRAFSLNFVVSSPRNFRTGGCPYVYLSWF